MRNDYKKYGIEKELLLKIIKGYLYTNSGAKKLSWFYEVDLKIVKEIIKDIKSGVINYEKI